MRLALVIALLATAVVAAGVSAQQLGANYTAGYANATLAGASSYIRTVNQSGYLIFYPNLTQAYGYLGKAEAAYNRSSPAEAVLYANEARASAEEQYQDIGAYRNESFAVMAVLVVLSAGVVVMSMRKAKTEKRRGKR